MKTIGLIASGNIEVFTLLRYIPVKKKLKLDEFDAYYFKNNGYEIFLIKCDKQLASARRATSLLIDKISPLLIVSFGVGGAIEEDIHVGDIVCGNSTTMIENGVFEQYIGLSAIPSDIRNFIFDLLVENKKRIFLGTIITVNGEQDLLDYTRIRFNHPVLEMETHGVAQAAHRRRIPIFSLRGITHNLAIEGNINLHTIFDFTWQYDKGRALRKLLTHPWVLFKLVGFYKTKFNQSNQVASTIYSLLQVLSLDCNTNSEDADYRI